MTRGQAVRDPAAGAHGAAGAPEPQGPSAPLVDAHCHLGFLADPAAFARAAGARGVRCLCATVDPAEYARLAPALAGARNAVVGLGLHPWWVAADDAARAGQLAAFERLAPEASLVSEVGLDFGPAHAGTRTAQAEAFRRICAACAQPLPARPGQLAARRVVSIHAVRAAGAALDILEEAGAADACACVFHWFSGTSDELTRARRAGCWFSVNARMLATKRGRAYARALPANRLLLETDLPSRAGEPLSPAQQAAALQGALDALAALRGDPDLPRRIAQNVAALRLPA